MGATVSTLIKNEGVASLYNGLSASVLRQLLYSTARFGIYEEVKHHVGPDAGSHVLVAIAWCSGFVGGVAGNFADVLNVRMQYDGTISADRRKKYRHVGDGMIRMAREEGLNGYFRGWLPNCTRAASQTAGQLASYDIIKDTLLSHTQVEDTPAVQGCSAFLAGLLATTATNPIDVVKTRIMTSPSGVRKGMFAVAGDAFRQEGMLWMVRGWVPSFLRIGP